MAENIDSQEGTAILSLKLVREQWPIRSWTTG